MFDPSAIRVTPHPALGSQGIFAGGLPSLAGGGMFGHGGPDWRSALMAFGGSMFSHRNPQFGNMMQQLAMQGLQNRAGPMQPAQFNAQPLSPIGQPSGASFGNNY